MASLDDPGPGRRDPWESLGGFRLSSEAANQRGAGGVAAAQGIRSGAPEAANPPNQTAAGGPLVQDEIRAQAPQASAANLEAPMPSQVVAVLVAPGDRVVKGQELVVVEAMKMEHSIKAPIDGVIATVLCAVGDKVDRGRTLVELVQPESPS